MHLVLISGDLCPEKFSLPHWTGGKLGHWEDWGILFPHSRTRFLLEQREPVFFLVREDGDFYLWVVKNTFSTSVLFQNHILIAVLSLCKVYLFIYWISLIPPPFILYSLIGRPFLTLMWFFSHRKCSSHIWRGWRGRSRKLRRWDLTSESDIYLEGKRRSFLEEVR